ncbi:uncharacterized protein EI90DRAFT_3020544 [Cantharellus anzutake]|uniref:uncharacterized protein n=1 Tax=Cantharellus anzutake TaxID=1750568 RepID=UPI001906342F|nr:uncharacterized protein EI90DRAFT_3020544 [Cantharellus anzutake]KAF8320185.1 hypothetical protein EI90DRAFT_3020544 [Cantharellus anzutake]
MDASILVLPEDEGSAQASITPTATTSSHQNSGNAVAGTAGNTINTAEGSFHDTIPAATEPLAFPESASVDDFLTDLDEGIEPSLEPTLSDSSSTIAPSFASSTIKKVTSIASAAAFFAECLDSRPYRIFSVRTFCESLVNSRRAANARIVSVQRYGDLQGVPHRFLIMHVTRADGREFYLRLDRRRDRQVSWLLFGVRDLGTSRAIDTAAVSGRLDHLLDHTNKKSGVEAIMIFPAPVPLIAAAQVLYAIAAESPDYKLTKEMLLRRFGAKYERGSLNHPTIGAERRDRITVLTYSHIAKDINAKTETVIKFADLMENSRLTKAVKSFIDTVNYHVRE